MSAPNFFPNLKGEGSGNRYGAAMVKGSKRSTWSLPLERELLARPGAGRKPKALTTIGEARAFLLKLEAERSQRQHWQRAAALLLEASESGDAGDATHQVYLALFLDGLLWMPPRRPRA